MKGPQHASTEPEPRLSKGNNNGLIKIANNNNNNGGVERESKIARVKRMLTGHHHQHHHHHHHAARAANPLTYDEAKANCKARKRKERQESVSSISQERKVIRSNSEERPRERRGDGGGVSNETAPKIEIRRVSSHEDFQKPTAAEQKIDDDLVPNGIGRDGPIGDDECSAERARPSDATNNYYIYDDYEHECRRSKERFSRSVAQRGRFGCSQHKKPKAKHFPKAVPPLPKEKHDAAARAKPDDCVQAPEAATRPNDGSKTKFLQLHHQPEEKERSPSPVHTPVSPAIDLTTLHQQIDGSEPLPSTSNRLEETVSSLSIVSNRLLSSPRNSVIVTERIYLNPDVPQTSNELCHDAMNPLEQRLKQLAKQIKSTKKKIKRYDEEFEAKFGYKPSHADKLYDKSVKKLCGDLSKLKREQRQLKEDSSSILIVASGTRVDEGQPKAVVTLQDTLTEIEKRLANKRHLAERGTAIEELNGEELMEEKVAMQKALLYLQSVHGRPNNKEDKDLVRPLYDRYRTLKRMVARLTMTSGTVNELATIHEHETMDFTSQPSPAAVDVEPIDKTAKSTSTDSDASDASSIGENLHALTLDELLAQKRVVGEEKKQLRRTLKEFENEFQLKTGRKLQKDDKQPMDGVYTAYKKTKARLRLIEALVEKQNIN